MTDADIGFLPASELLDRYRDRSLSPVEVVSAVLRHIERQEPALNAMVTLTPRYRDGRGHPGRSRLCRRHRPQARGRARDHQGPAADQGRAHPDGQPHVRGPRPRRRHPLRHPPARRGVHHGGQDHRPRVRLEGREPEPAHRHHPQSVGAWAERGRLLLRGGCRVGGGLRTAAPGRRRRRVDPHPGPYVRRVRHEADAWPDTVLANVQQRRRHPSGPHLPHRDGTAH